LDHLASRLRHEGIWARTIDVKIRNSDFRTVTRSTTLSEATNVTNVIWKAAADLFERSLTKELMLVRLLGIGATKLTREAVVQGTLFDNEADVRQGALDSTIDKIRGQFGTGSIRRGSLVERLKGAEAETDQ
jgi:DNA polymerase-4